MSSIRFNRRLASRASLGIALVLGLLSTSLTATEDFAFAEETLQQLKWRSIGPYRGGRSAAVAGHADQPRTYYFGGAGGGVWKTLDAGASWASVSDTFFGGSIGAIEVAPSDPNVVYVGGGEVTVRGNISHGYGMFRSDDAGKTWRSIGLEDSRRIPRIRVHPRDADLVYAAVLGHLYGPSEQRGVYRSKDGGETWERVLFVSDEVGAVDLCLEPGNPRVIYASTWRIKRTPWSLESGGEGSGLFKSTDDGESWEEITENKGLPERPVGIIGVSVSAANPQRVFAMVEAAEGGLFRSEDGGETWQQLNSDRSLRQRAWYYTRIYADPQQEDVVYVVNVGFHRSKDGGKTFHGIRTPHGDHHDLWIDPTDSRRMIIADDGGGQVTFDRGATWSTMDNQPTAQFYRVTTDNHFPYRIYGAQQDNSTVRIFHRTSGFGIGERDWEPTAGGESGHIAPHPLDADIVYGGSYGGYLTRRNHRTGEFRNVHVWPDNPMGWGAEELKYRFQWNFPIFFSPHDPDLLYCAANVLFRSRDEGQSWKVLSPDLTRNDAGKLGPSGGPITKDNTSVEYYCTIFAALESPHEPGVLWCGSDDGLLHLSRDDGASWKNVTPSHLPEWIQINSIEVHPTHPGGLYVAATMYKSDDFRPYLYKTEDYGRNWTRIDHGIDEQHFTRVIRADPGRPGLLYAGTESGVYVTFDDGRHWQPLQLNLPVVPVTDLVLKDNDLVAATQGRSFWVLDDVTPLHELSPQLAEKSMHLFAPRPCYRMGGRGGGRGTRGENPPNGAVLRFLISEEMAEKTVTIAFQDSQGRRLRRYCTKPGEDWTEEEKKAGKLEVEAGMNQLVWDLRVDGATKFDGMVLWGGGLSGPRVPPGEYVAKLLVEDQESSHAIEVLKDPRSSATQQDLEAQYEFLMEIRDKLTEVHKTIAQGRSVQGQLEDLRKRLKKADLYSELREASEKLEKEFLGVEEALYQTKNQSPQDPLNYPIRLNNKLSSLVGAVSRGDARPTDAARQVKEELVGKIDQHLQRFEQLVEGDLKKFNQDVHEAAVPAILLQSESTKSADEPSP